MKSPQVKVKGKRGSPFGFVKVETSSNNSSKPSAKTMHALMPPKVFPDMLSGEVRRRTGFDGSSAMISYIVIVCNGDFDRIKERRSSLRFEE